MTTAQYKGVVANALCEALRPVRERAVSLQAQPAFLQAVLQHGAVRARQRADEVYQDVTNKLGLAVPRLHSQTRAATQ